MTTIEQRLRTIETQVRIRGCDDCRNLPAIAIVFGDEPDPEMNCPVCGREVVENVIRFTDRDDGPQ